MSDPVIAAMEHMLKTAEQEEVSLANQVNRAREMRERPRNAFWKQAVSRGTADKKLARLERREQELYGKLVSAQQYTKSVKANIEKYKRAIDDSQRTPDQTGS